MTFTYTILPEPLHATANAAMSWFVKNWGIPKANFQIEAEVESDVGFRPTFVARTRDGHILCVEVSDTIYKNTLDSFVLDCQRTGRPIKLVVAVAKPISDPDYPKKHRQAKRAGVGILEVNEKSGELIERPLSLTLASLRPVKADEFPTRYRESLVSAEGIFRDGEPSKACLSVYEELEDCFRKFARKCEQDGIWVKPPKMNLDTVAWAKLVASVKGGIERRDRKARLVTDALLSRVHGVTSYRNESGHKPNTEAARRSRDAALRTRFESAIDLLKEFVNATKPFKI